MFRALDIGGTQIKQADVTKEGKLLTTTTASTPKNKSAFLSFLRDMLHELPEDCEGIGISCPGKIDTATKTVYHGGSLDFLDGFCFAEVFTDLGCTLPLALQNDGKAAVLGEYWLGNLKTVKNGIVVTLGTGVGGGILIDGNVLEGKNFQAGEFSFLLNQIGLPEKQTMFGANLSAANFIKRVATRLELEDLTDGKAVFEAIKQQDHPEVNALFEDYCFAIAVFSFNLQIMFDPDKILIGGGISAQSCLVAEIKRQYQKIHTHNAFYQHTFEPVTIEACAFQNQANLLGAVYPLRTKLSAGSLNVDKCKR